DKASEAITAIDAGTLRIPAGGPRQGDVVKVGQCLGFLVAPGEEVPSAPPASQAAVTAERDTVSSETQPAARSSRGSRAISPRARRAARQLGVDWSQLTGSGRTGRIVERDVRAALAGGATAGRVVPLSPVRRVIAQRMTASARTTAPVTLTTRA